MKFVDDELKDPGLEIHRSTFIAAKMDTTLWFTAAHDKNRTLDHLIACGQYTICYNLLIYLTELEYSDQSPIKGQCFNQKEFKMLYDELMRKWISFKKEPLNLLESLLQPTK